MNALTGEDFATMMGEADALGALTDCPLTCSAARLVTFAFATDAARTVSTNRVAHGCVTYA